MIKTNTELNKKYLSQIIHEEINNVLEADGASFQNPNFDAGLAQILQKEDNAKMLYQLGTGEHPGQGLASLLADFINPPGGKSKNWRDMFFVIKAVNDDLAASAKQNARKNTPETDKFVFKDEKTREQMQNALMHMTAVFSLDPRNEEIQKIAAGGTAGLDTDKDNEETEEPEETPETLEEGLLGSFLGWVRGLWNDLKVWLSRPLATTMTFIEKVIRLPGMIYDRATGQRPRCTAAAIVYPEYEITVSKKFDVKLPLGHAAVVIIHADPLPASQSDQPAVWADPGPGKEEDQPSRQISEQEEGKIKLTFAEFGRYGSSPKGAIKGTKKDFKQTAAIRRKFFKTKYNPRSDIGTVRAFSVSLPASQIQWERGGDLTQESKLTIIGQIEQHKYFGKYATAGTDATTRVSWIRGIDPDKAVEVIKSKKTGPYSLVMPGGLFGTDTKGFGTWQNGKWTQTGKNVTGENCGTFVASVINGACIGSNCASYSAKIRRQLAVNPMTITGMLANEFDEETNEYATGEAGGVSGDMYDPVETGDWVIPPDLFKRARGCRGGRAFTRSVRRKGVTAEKFYAEVARLVPAELIKVVDPAHGTEKARWNKGRTGPMSRKLAAIIQHNLMGPQEVDGCIGPKTWAAMTGASDSK